MILNIEGCENADLQFHLYNAGHFFAKELLTAQMLPHIHVNIIIKPLSKELGTCCVTHYNSWYKPRTFRIELRKHRSLKSTLLTLAHEMVHVKQYATGELNIWLNKWQKQKIDTTSISYSQLPWEIEANIYERLLYNTYKEEIE